MSEETKWKLARHRALSRLHEAYGELIDMDPWGHTEDPGETCAKDCSKCSYDRFNTVLSKLMDDIQKWEP